jgi:hypothetical protein
METTMVDNLHPMNVDELIKKAWDAVESAGVPESVQEVAFKEAVGILKAEYGPSEGGERSTPPAPPTPKRPRSNVTRAARSPTATEDANGTVSEENFFKLLATESGVDEGRLRDCFQLTSTGSVHVTPPTKDLGDSKRGQAQALIALVAGARSRGLGEGPVSANAVRDEIKRKHCWDANNFSNKHLGEMRGFNTGSNRNEIVLTSKWLDEFKVAVDTVLGDAAAPAAGD